MPDVDDNSQFPSDPHLTAISIAWRNPDHLLIADEVCPRDTGLGDTKFSYTTFDDTYKAYTLPQTSVGPRGRVNRIEAEGRRVTVHTEDEALDLPLSFNDLKNPQARPHATQLLTSIIQLRHEYKVASLYFDPATYPVELKTELVGDDRFDAALYDGNALLLLNEWLRKPLVKPNLLVFGGEAWSVFRALPEVVAAAHGNAGDKGLAARQRVAELLEVQEVIVGEGRLNIAKPGEAPSIVEVWGPHIAGIYRNRAASTVGGITFGFCGQYQTRLAGAIPDKVGIGMRGGELVRVGESVKPVIVAPHAGFFLENVVGTA